MRPSREHPAPGGKHAADLVAHFGSDRHRGQTLVVEVKVDSPVGERQIRNLTSNDPTRDQHVLLAVGAEGLRLFGDTRKNLRLDSNGWRVVDVIEWDDLLAPLSQLPKVICDYRDRVKGEVTLQADARQAAQLPTRRRADLSPREELVYAWAWLSEVADSLHRADRDGCEPKREPRSGPKMYLWYVWFEFRNGWRRECYPDYKNFGLWLELDTRANGLGRRVAIKIGADGADESQKRAALAEAGRTLLGPHLPGGSCLPRRGRQITLWTRDLQNVSAIEAAGVCEQVMARAKTHGPALLEAAHVATAG